MARFPVDAHKSKGIKALEGFRFSIVREKEHISMIRQNPDGTTTPLTLPNHKPIKGSTLRSICTQSGISRDDFIAAYEQV
jgi:hypothetical protein